MKSFRDDTALGRYLAAIARTVHPVRAIFEVCGTVLFAIPFLAAFAMTRSAPLYLYLLYPLLFLISHFVWFRLPSVDRKVRWFLFWSTLTLVAALGAGFMFWSYKEAAARGASFPPSGIFAIPQWVSPNIDVPFLTAALYFLAPSGAGAAVYCLVLALFLRVYKKYRAEEHRRRSPGGGRGE
ncbi:MAG: hypothetical protein ABSF77_10380 [Spirochaetia bacterium]|jgi:hypothetical protein